MTFALRILTSPTASSVPYTCTSSTFPTATPAQFARTFSIPFPQEPTFAAQLALSSLHTPFKLNAPAARNSQPPLSPHTRARSTRTPACPPGYTSRAARDVGPSPSGSAARPALAHSVLLPVFRLRRGRSVWVRRRGGPGGRAGGVLVLVFLVGEGWRYLFADYAQFFPH